MQPDDLNRVQQTANSLLVETDDGRLGLVDTGCGPASKFSEKEISLHGLGPGWPLLENLAARGIQPEKIDFITFTHLHWDHAGGADPNIFCNAELIVHEIEWADAHSRDPLLYKSYPPETVDPLKAGFAGRTRFLTDEKNALGPGLRLARSGGHTRGHCATVFEGALDFGSPHAGMLPAVNLAVFAGDVCSSRHNLRLVFQMSYDTFPLDTRRWKREWLPRIAREGGLLLFDHDSDIFGATLRQDPKEEFVVEATLPAA